MASRFVIPPGALPQRHPVYSVNPVYKEQPRASPIHLSGDVLLQPGASGAVEPSKLVNPMGQDMEILEIKFTVSSGPGDLSANPAAFGGSVQCELRLGDIKITNGAVPVWNFGKAENVYSERLTQGGNTTQGVPINYYAVFSWKLPRPLFVPAGSMLTAQFNHTGLLLSNLHVRVGYSARTVFIQPKTINVPWAAVYISKAFNPITEAHTDSSTPWQLVNANPEPLVLQRFVGRTLFRSNAPNVDNPTYAENFPQTLNAFALTMRISDSYGRPVVRNFLPWNSIINSPTRSWELENGAIMDPFAFYRVELRQLGIGPAPNDANDGSYQAFFSLVGWREVKP
jgi:hypothetical protein